MSVRGSSSSLGRGNPTSSSQYNKNKGTIVPHPVNPIPSVDLVNRYQLLGTIPKPYNTVLASQPKPVDPFCDSQPSNPKPNNSQFILKYEANLFHIEKFMKPINDPVKLASQYFPIGWHFTPLAPYKSLTYYKEILLQTESIFIKPIYDRNDSSKVIFHSLYIKQIISMPDWGNHPSDLKLLDNLNSNFCYYDYIEAWNKIFLYQNQSFNHSWFIQFDHKFKSQIPLWFTLWWTRFGSSFDIFPHPLKAQVHHFCNHSPYNSKFDNIHILLQFVSKYKIPWILKWQYNLQTPVTESVFQSPSSSQNNVTTSFSQLTMVTRIFFIKWWDKFDIDRIIGQVQKEFPLNPVPIKSIPSKGSSSKPKESKSKLFDVSDIKSCSSSELKVLAQAIQDRVSKLHEESEASECSSSSSKKTINSQNDIEDPYGSINLQDAQDPFA